MNVIEIEHLYKKYLIHHERAPTADSLKEILSKGAKRLAKKMLSHARSKMAFPLPWKNFGP